MANLEPPNQTESDAYFRVCSTCRKPIGFGERYYRCSVSTCNRNRLALYFCSVPCWDAHVPEARHRDAWAEEARAPTRAEWQAERQAQAAREGDDARAAGAAPNRDSNPAARGGDVPTADASRERKIVTLKSESDAPEEVLVVVSKLKAYVKARSGFNTSDAVMEVLSSHLRRICDRAVERAQSEGRKTVLDRDVRAVLGRE
ncbi:MAG TPA: hypothetical protein VFQ61_32260 [Polyangiaceae bacterium]|nr:hypothetical protein [Polyangiaceae bacterium]